MDALSERYLDGVYDEFSREHLKLLQNMKAAKGDDKANQKQVAMISALLVAILRLRNYRKQLSDRGDYFFIFFFVCRA